VTRKNAFFISLTSFLLSIFHDPVKWHIL